MRRVCRAPRVGLTPRARRFMPVMLHRFSAAQWSVLLVQLFETYGELFSDDFLVQTLLLATPYEQRLLLQHFVPHYVARRSAVTGALFALLCAFIVLSDGWQGAHT